MTNAFDESVLYFFANLNTPEWLDKFMILWTGYSPYLIIIITIALIFFKKTRRTGITGLIALIFSPLLVEALWKNLFSRVRPYEQYDFARLLVDPSTSFSFPSGHSSFAFAGAVALCYKSPAWARIALIFGAFLTAFSRVYVSIHYATDVIAGIINGTLCAVAAILIVNYFEKRRQQTAGQPKP